MDNNILKGIFHLPTFNPTVQMNSSLIIWNLSSIFPDLILMLTQTHKVWTYKYYNS